MELLRQREMLEVQFYGSGFGLAELRDRNEDVYRNTCGQTEVGQQHPCSSAPTDVNVRFSIYYLIRYVIIIYDTHITYDFAY